MNRQYPFLLKAPAISQHLLGKTYMYHVHYSKHLRHPLPWKNINNALPKHPHESKTNFIHVHDDNQMHPESPNQDAMHYLRHIMKSKRRSLLAESRINHCTLTFSCKFMLPIHANDGGCYSQVHAWLQPLDHMT